MDHFQFDQVVVLVRSRPETVEKLTYQQPWNYISQELLEFYPRRRIIRRLSFRLQDMAQTQKIIVH